MPGLDVYFADDPNKTGYGGTTERPHCNQLDQTISSARQRTPRGWYIRKVHGDKALVGTFLSEERANSYKQTKSDAGDLSFVDAEVEFVP